MKEKEHIKVSVVVGVVIKKDNKYLLVQEKKLQAYGLWNFPAGRVDAGEQLEQSAIREAKEETGYDIELIKEISIFHITSESPVKHVFEARIIGGELNFPEDEILDTGWFTFNEIKKMKNKLRAEWVIDSINILENK